MKRLSAEKRFSTAQNALMNTVGTVTYFFFQWLITLAVVRLSTDENVGLLQLAMTVSNAFLALANYNMRVYQVSDIRREYAAGHYTASRLLTCGLAFVLCVGYAALWGYPLRTVLCIALYLLYRLTESLADVLHGVDQNHDRMDHVAVSMVLRAVLMVACFVLVLRLSGSVLAASGAMFLVTLAVVLGYDLPAAARYEDIRPRWDREKIQRLLLACLPNMAATVAFISIVTLSRQFLSDLQGQVILGYYATVATPVVFVQVVMASLMNPVVGDISAACLRRDRPAFLRLHARLFLLVAAVGLLALGGILLLGEPVMVFLYGEKVRAYIDLMPLVLCTTVLYALCCILQNTLVILRRMMLYLVFAGLSLLLTLVLGRPVIQAWGPNGVSIVICLSYLLFLLCSLVPVVREIQIWRREAVRS